MKTIIFLILVFGAAYVFPQQVPEKNSTEKNKKEQNISTDGQDQTAKGNFEGKKEKLRKPKDVFIDKDGDGICDTRQSGMSFGKMRRRMGEGKSGPGDGSGHRYGGSGSGSGNGAMNGSGSGNGYGGGR